MMKRAAILLAFLFLGCTPPPEGKHDPTTRYESRVVGCKVYTIEGRKFAVCDNYRGLAIAPFDSCK